MKRTRPAMQSKSKKVAKTKKANTLQMYKQPSSGNVRLIRRNVDMGNLVCTLSTPTYAAFTFRLVNVFNSTEFTALFDQYKINAVQLMFFPQQTAVTRVNFPGETAYNGRILTAIDYNDSTPPTQLDELREYENVEVHSAVENFSVYIDKPKYVDNTGALRTGYIGTSSPSTIHYGLKTAVEILNPGSAGTYTYRLEAVYYMSFKAIK